MTKQKETKVTIGFKTDSYVRDILQEIATKEERTVSSIVNRIVKKALASDIKEVLEVKSNENI